MNSLTPAQVAAIQSRGNILLEAGAGSGKTSTLVARCMARLLDETAPISLDEILMVTFTEAAAAEMRKRIREALTQKVLDQPENERIHEHLAQLDQARIGTLHGFCFRLIRDHFHELGLDPQLQVLDEAEARLIAAEALRDLFDLHFDKTRPDSPAVLDLIRVYGEGDDQPIQELVLTVHRHLQALPDPDGWLERQLAFWTTYDEAHWQSALQMELNAALPGWLELLDTQPAENDVAHACARWLREHLERAPASDPGPVLRRLAGQLDDANWPQGTKGKYRDPIAPILEEAANLASFTPTDDSATAPLADDFHLLRPHLLALLQLVCDFGSEFATRKRQRGGLDFNDLEQFTLKLLWNRELNQPTETALHWRGLIREVFVDEYQDINEVQDRIIAALSREGPDANRFLVGDIKQSIYAFRLARPDIFLRYARDWRDNQGAGQVLPLSDNFRSHEAILQFVNQVFTSLLREDVGGVDYPGEAHLRLGAPEQRTVFSRASDAQPRVELTLRLTTKKSRSNPGEDLAEEELTSAEREATLAATRLIELKSSGTTIFDRESSGLRPVTWRDMAILLRAASGKAEIYARVFARAGIPLQANRRGFFDAIEISDLTSLFMLLDNPRQDIPLLAVLRSPLVGLSPDELVAVRTTAPAENSFWVALNRFHELGGPAAPDALPRIARFLSTLARWREQVRRGSLSQCLEDILDATDYLAWLATQPRGAEQAANVQRFLELTRQYDSWQGRGLHRFLEYVRLIDGDGQGPEPAPPPQSDAIRLMTIHASKGLEFPVVLLADLNKAFRQDSPTTGMLVDDELGLCPTVNATDNSKSYPSIALLLARRRARQRMIAEEIRLLYVAMTRACDRLLLLGTVAESRVQEVWAGSELTQRRIINSRSLLDLLGPLLPGLCERDDWHTVSQGSSSLVDWRIIQSDQPLPTPPKPGVAADAPMAQTALPDLSGLQSRIEFRYPFLQATQQTGKTTVTRIRRQIAEQQDSEAGVIFPEAPRKRTRKKVPGMSAAEIGIAHHLFFQIASLDAVGSTEELSSETKRLVAAGLLGEHQAAALRLDDILRFWQSDAGRAIQGRSKEVHRELEFTAAFSVEELDRLAGTTSPTSGSAQDLVIVQGVVDLAVIGRDEIWILDYKTDDIDGTQVAERTQHYHPQVELYRLALQKVFDRPVRRVWLHFLTPHETVAVNDRRN